MKRGLTLCWLSFSLTIIVYAMPYASKAYGYLYLSLLAILQACILLIPSLIVYRTARVTRFRILAAIFHAVAIASLMVLIANYKLHSMYNFFVDGFVINLMITPGGIDALGLSPSFYLSSSILLLISALLYAGLVRCIPFEYLLENLPARRYVAIFITVVAVSETATYAYASYTSERQLLSIANRVIWHIPVSARGFYQKLGVPQADRQLAEPLQKYSGDMVYPPKGILSARASRPLNIVWLTAESLRADMLTEEIMPNTWRFSQYNSRFNNHYSGGNGTRLGMFSQFYGLYGSYWFDALEGRQSPLLIDTLIDNDYDITAFTSARFTYPEFDKTIFSRIPESSLREYYQGKGWERDRTNTAALVDHIGQMAKREQLFFTFMFFESSHANYYFPETYAIRENYLGDFDYLSVDIGKNIDLIKNRYINASHYLDSRLGLVFKALRDNDLEHNTIVIVTGDHGEEFMEKGRWGHNSTFVQEQIRVPLVVRVPGTSSRVVETMTSHLDLPATVLAALGYDADPSLYSFGENLLSEQYERNYTVASDWHGNVLITPAVKFVLSLKGAGNRASLTTLNDRAIEGDEIRLSDRELLSDFIQSLPRFYLDSPAYRYNMRVAARQRDALETRSAGGAPTSTAAVE